MKIVQLFRLHYQILSNPINWIQLKRHPFILYYLFISILFTVNALFNALGVYLISTIFGALIGEGVNKRVGVKLSIYGNS